MKIRKDILLINILILTNILEGVVWEAIGIMIIAYFLIKEVFHSSIRIRQWKKIFFFLIIWILYYLMQCIVLDLDFASMVRLYGITKCICMPCIIMICLYSRCRNNDTLLWIMPLIVLIGIFAVIDYSFNTKIFPFFSLNYISAIFIILSIFILKAMPEKYKISKILFLGLTFGIVLLSGSRTSLAAIVLVIGYICITEQDIKKRQRYLGLGGVLFFVLLILVLTFGFNNDYNATRNGTTLTKNIARALSVFTAEGRFDQARADLWTRSFAQFQSESSTEKLIGLGDNREHIVGSSAPHNFLMEVFLCYGIVGFVIYCVFFAYQIVVIMSNSKNKSYALLIGGMAVFFGLLHPFITTGSLYQTIVGLMLLNCFAQEGSYRGSNISDRKYRGKWNEKQ